MHRVDVKSVALRADAEELKAELAALEEEPTEVDSILARQNKNYCQANAVLAIAPDTAQRALGIVRKY